MNPRIQPCLEQQVLSLYASQETSLLTAIDIMAALDTSYLSSAATKMLHNSLGKARETFVKVDDIYQAKAQLTDFEQSYEPLHQQVREIQLNVRRNKGLIEDAKLELRRLDDIELNDNRRADLFERIDALEQFNTRLEASIPASWATQRPIFEQLNKAEKQSRNDYRRNVDEAYEGIKELRLWISQAPELAQAQADVAALVSSIDQLSADEAMDAIKRQEKNLSEFAGVSGIKSKLSKARRALKGSKYNPEKAKGYHSQAMDLLTAEIQWRQRAFMDMAPALSSYNLAIKDSIGLRQQERMSIDLATTISACMSSHKDISLQF
jgi:5-bromo-4-chloroindolyl phosphate hydrolysis protein